jgi:endonuclease/exonuclease/phosphatase (EEP) superfamily protein YafD
MEAARILIYIFGYMFIVFALIPLIRNDNWIFRIFEYPRSQKLCITAIIFVLAMIFCDFSTTHDRIFLALLAVNLCYLSYQVWPYTIIAKNQMKRITRRDPAREFKLFIANVYQDNRDVKSCMRIVEEHNPDILLLVETDAWWKNELDKKLLSRYPQTLGLALDNTYGMLLYSKFPLVDGQVKFLVESDIPSIDTKVRLPSGQMFLLFGLHPKPPVPQETASSTERDAEILLIAKKAKDLKIPVIVAGDLNDVAWSYTTDLFLKVSRLIDPRRGRGFFNTFNAHYWFLRWPLDHVFCSEHFHLVDLKRMPSIGSDHFPMLASIQLCEEQKAENEKEILKADPKEEQLATRKIRKAV